jgi:hypothetical protein
MIKPDDALLWARERFAKQFDEHKPEIAASIRRGSEDWSLSTFADAYRAGEMAEAKRAQALVNFAVAMEEHDDNEVCDAAWDALDTYWGRP